jgi:spermidine/putrescine transport system permease protein
MVKKILGKSYLALVLLFLYVPIFYIMLFSFTQSNVMGVWNGFTFDLFIDLFTGPKSGDIGHAVLNTLILAACASLLSTVLGTMAALGIYYSKKRTRKIMNTVNQIPILNADIVTSISISILFTTLSLGKGFGTLLVAHTVLCTPYVILSVMPRIRQLNKNIYEAALDLGATPSKAILKVILPEIMPGMLTGFILSFTLSIDDFIFTIFNTQDYTTLTKFIFDDATRGGLTAELRALSTVIFLLVFSVLLIVNFKTKNKVVEHSYVK